MMITSNAIMTSDDLHWAVICTGHESFPWDCCRQEEHCEVLVDVRSTMNRFKKPRKPAFMKVFEKFDDKDDRGLLDMSIGSMATYDNGDYNKSALREPTALQKEVVEEDPPSPGPDLDMDAEPVSPDRRRSTMQRSNSDRKLNASRQMMETKATSSSAHDVLGEINDDMQVERIENLPDTLKKHAESATQQERSKSRPNGGFFGRFSGKKDEGCTLDAAPELEAAVTQVSGGEFAASFAQLTLEHVVPADMNANKTPPTLDLTIEEDTTSDSAETADSVDQTTEGRSVEDYLPEKEATEPSKDEHLHQASEQALEEAEAPVRSESTRASSSNSDSYRGTPRSSLDDSTDRRHRGPTQDSRSRTKGSDDGHRSSRRKESRDKEKSDNDARDKERKGHRRYKEAPDAGVQVWTRSVTPDPDRRKQRASKSSGSRPREEQARDDRQRRRTSIGCSSDLQHRAEPVRSKDASTPSVPRRSSIGAEIPSKETEIATPRQQHSRRRMSIGASPSSERIVRNRVGVDVSDNDAEQRSPQKGNRSSKDHAKRERHGSEGERTRSDSISDKKDEREPVNASFSFESKASRQLPRHPARIERKVDRTSPSTPRVAAKTQLFLGDGVASASKTEASTDMDQEIHGGLSAHKTRGLGERNSEQKAENTPQKRRTKAEMPPTADTKTRSPRKKLGSAIGGQADAVSNPEASIDTMSLESLDIFDLPLVGRRLSQAKPSKDPLCVRSATEVKEPFSDKKSSGPKKHEEKSVSELKERAKETNAGGSTMETSGGRQTTEDSATKEDAKVARAGSPNVLEQTFEVSKPTTKEEQLATSLKEFDNAVGNITDSEPETEEAKHAAPVKSLLDDKNSAAGDKDDDPQFGAASAENKSNGQHLSPVTPDPPTPLAPDKLPKETVSGVMSSARPRPRRTGSRSKGLSSQPPLPKAARRRRASASATAPVEFSWQRNPTSPLVRRASVDARASVASNRSRGRRQVVTRVSPTSERPKISKQLALAFAPSMDDSSNKPEYEFEAQTTEDAGSNRAMEFDLVDGESVSDMLPRAKKVPFVSISDLLAGRASTGAETPSDNFRGCLSRQSSCESFNVISLEGIEEKQQSLSASAIDASCIVKPTEDSMDERRFGSSLDEFAKLSFELAESRIRRHEARRALDELKLDITMLKERLHVLQSCEDNDVH